MKNFEVYENIKERRIQLGMSQEELAAKVGYTHRGVISKIEAGKTNLTLEKLDAIAKALNTTAAKLTLPSIDCSKTQSIDSPIVAEVCKAADLLNEQQQQRLLEYAKMLIGTKIDK